MRHPQSEQMADLRKGWAQTKADAEKEHGTAEHLELPDIIIRHEISYEAPPGKANADRPMPLPRPLVRSRKTFTRELLDLSVVSFGRRYLGSVNRVLKLRRRTVFHACPPAVVQETIVDSMQLPPGLDVTPDDPEYEQLMNMWTSVSRNNTMDEVRVCCSSW